MLILLLILFLTYCAGQSSDCLSSTDSTTLTTNALDEDTIEDLKTEVQQSSIANEMLKVRLDLLTVRLKQQTETINALRESLNSEADCRHVHGYAPLLDVRANYGNQSQKVTCTPPENFPSNCAEAASSKRFDGIYTIKLDSISDKPFLVFCDETTQGGGWTVIQRRKDGSVDFFRDWNSYKIGFGNLETEFFIGLEKLHVLTTENGPQELLIVMSNFEGVTKYAKYSTFAIGNENEGYAINVLGKYSGDAGDSLTNWHGAQKFTTKDRDNDMSPANCAIEFKGAWWYSHCHSSNLNGLYLKGIYERDKYAQGVIWFDWHGYYYSLKDVKMMIRPIRI